MNNLKSDEKKCEESVIEDNGVWRWEQLRTRGGNRRKGKFSTERRHKETEPNRSRGKTFTGAGKREVCEYRKGKVRERKTSRERAGKKKVRQGDGKCSGEKGYLCLGVVGAAGRLLKASHVEEVGERERARERLFERRLTEQRAQNCSIRLSRESYSKNEFQNSAK